MILDTIRELGPWTWILLGIVLLGLELVIPGVFLMWLGLAALVLGGVSLLRFEEASGWPWQAQAVAFVVLSVLFAMMGTRVMRGREGGTNGVNDGLTRFTGRTATLVSPIENGTGRVKLGDTVWRVTGPDMAAGATVRVTGARGETLTVEPA